jgi:hypothetical protein
MVGMVLSSLSVVMFVVVDGPLWCVIDSKMLKMAAPGVLPEQPFEVFNV